MKKAINKLLGTLILFLIYLDNIVQDDLSILKPIGKFFIKPAWFIRAVFIYLLSPLFFIWFLIINTEFYVTLKKEYDDFNKLMATRDKELKI